MTKYLGMYRRAELRRQHETGAAIFMLAAHLAGEAACAGGRHKQETDPDTGDEVCQRCGLVLDDYADVALADEW